MSAGLPDRSPKDPSPGPPTPPPAAAAVFGARLETAVAYAALLADTGVSHGLLGPREVPRLWDRHLLNCAVVGELVPVGCTVVDVGSGAGLPGLALAVARPDLRVHLVEPLARRVAWLDGVVAELGLETVSVHRARAEGMWRRLEAPVVTARAVARLGVLAGWCRPLLAPGGRLLAIKGASAAAELAEERLAVRRAGFADAQLRPTGVGLLDPPTTVVLLQATQRGPRPRRRP